MITHSWTEPNAIAWAMGRLGRDFPTDATSCAVMNGETILAVIVFSRWTQTNVELSIASDGSRRWFSRRLAREIFWYVFDHAGKIRLTTAAWDCNSDAVELNARLGFDVIGYITHWFGPNKNAMLYGWTRDQWLKSKWRTGNERRRKCSDPAAA